MQNCSVVIVNYNTGKLLSEVVKAVSSSDINLEIIVVDNNSVDESMVQLEAYPLIQKYFRDKNYGFADSCNYGASKTDSDLLLFLNPDCVVQENTISELMKSLKANQDAAIISCMVCNPDGSEQRASRRRLPTFWRTFKTVTRIEKLAKLSNFFAGVNLNHQKLPKKTSRVEAVSGALILMKSKVFNEIGGFDQHFPLHFEDLDLFKRTLDKGFKILFNPNLEVIHYQGTSSQSNPKVKLLKRLGLKRYFQKHGTKLSQFIINRII